MQIKRYDLEYHYYAGVMEAAEIEERSQGRYVLYEDVAPLLAERDTTPVDKAWLDSEWQSMLMRGVNVWDVCPGVEVHNTKKQGVFFGAKPFILKAEGRDMQNPTRGDVLTALRLFGGQGEEMAAGQ